MKTFRDLQTMVRGSVELVRLSYCSVKYLAAVNEDGTMTACKNEAEFAVGWTEHPINLYGPVVLLPPDFDVDSLPYE